MPLLAIVLVRSHICQRGRHTNFQLLVGLIPLPPLLGAHTPSPPLRPLSDTLGFNPASVTLTPTTALALAFTDFLPYRDRTLTHFPLSTLLPLQRLHHVLAPRIQLDQRPRSAHRVPLRREAAYEQATRLKSSRGRMSGHSC